MKLSAGTALVVGLLAPSAALAQVAPVQTATVAPATVQTQDGTTEPATQAPPATQPQAQAPQPLPPPPPQAPAVAPSTASGQWIYTDAYGWIWVPAESASYDVGEQPYVYIYTPTYGWTWYVSPWGRGHFYVGPWVHRAWGAPHVWYGGRWVARPHYYGHPGAAPRVHVARPVVVHHR